MVKNAPCGKHCPQWGKGGCIFFEGLQFISKLHHCLRHHGLFIFIFALQVRQGNLGSLKIKDVYILLFESKHNRRYWDMFQKHINLGFYSTCLLAFKTRRKVAICSLLVLKRDLSFRISSMQASLSLSKIGANSRAAALCLDNWRERSTAFCRCLIWSRIMALRL